MNYEGDVKLIQTDDGGDIEFVAGQPVMDQGLETAVYISLFSGDWWGNAISEQNEKLESNLEEIYNRNLSNKTRLDAEEYMRKALEWMIRLGIAKRIDVSASLPTPGWLGLEITIIEPNGSEQNLRYSINWAKQRVTMGV